MTVGCQFQAVRSEWTPFRWPHLASVETGRLVPTGIRNGLTRNQVVAAVCSFTASICVACKV